ncbi:unnamed protein product [Prorocentrum cordatum]|uniref:t-SNARE coiled-coil homology domain-containing protein n=1 Tax=Prorocentrum cordatum TaxID=2364126 RepID=A0ABN9WUG6_9DINO|nr:unnamed protein product [Polarella glacialis]
MALDAKMDTLLSQMGMVVASVQRHDTALASLTNDMQGMRNTMEEQIAEQDGKFGAMQEQIAALRVQRPGSHVVDADEDMIDTGLNIDLLAAKTDEKIRKMEGSIGKFAATYG